MPIYEYECKACRHGFESIQKISEPPLVDCPECGEPQLKKKISAVAFRLKGGGWYETDFKSGDKKNLHGERAKPDASGDAESTTKDASGSGNANGSDASKVASSNGDSSGAKASEPKS
ncbi:MAG: zinc ribbon domain-containing protein [Gammaproteobacteria bacterium]|nr:zinc ribbon domain-containing protein [Gammaproteobacteria bacterium]